MENWKRVIVSPETTLEEAMIKIDASGLQIALVLSPESRLLGIVTDGDFRRAILKGYDLTVPVTKVMNTHTTTVLTNTPREEILALMRQKLFHHVPIVDKDGCVVG